MLHLRASWLPTFVLFSTLLLSLSLNHGGVVVEASMRMITPRMLAARPVLPEFSCDAWTVTTGRCVAGANGTFNVSVLNSSVGAMGSRDFYQFGVFSAQIKFTPKNAKGVVFAFYLIDPITKSNKDPAHAEIDIEIYGGANSSTYMFTTNVFCGGKQNLEQQSLPFDPTLDYHTYSIQWSNTTISWFIDGQAVRILQRGVGAPASIWPQRPMMSRFTAWDCSGYCGPSNYTQGPIWASLKNPSAYGCVSASPIQQNIKCINIRSSKLPWNARPTQQQMLQASSTKNLLNAFGWDLA